MTENCIWAVVDPEISWNDWWSALLKFSNWPKDLLVEKWTNSDIQWPRVIDSAHSFTLFKQSKVIIVFDSDKALKGEKNSHQLLERLQKSPHRIVLHSTDLPPKGFSIRVWEATPIAKRETDEKAGFKWIDSIHAENLTAAMSSLDAAVEADQHPFALLQMLTRDFRIGRLIHHAHQARLRESEITTSLRVPPFVLQKWLRRSRLSNSQWSAIFDRLLEADLELKSGSEGIWVLRKVTFDLVQIIAATQSARSIPMKKIRKPSQPALQLWTAWPSFA